MRLSQDGPKERWGGGRGAGVRKDSEELWRLEHILLETQPTLQ